MVFELAEGGDLFQFLCNVEGQRVDEDEGRAVFRQVQTFSSIFHCVGNVQQGSDQKYGCFIGGWVYLSGSEPT